jgi:DNA-binding transcriptional ArsR family regulator
MSDDESVSVTSDPAFLAELSEYLEILSSPVRIRILTVIEREPLEIAEIALIIDASCADVRKHIETLAGIGLVKKEAGSRIEPAKGAVPFWKFSLVEGGLEMVIRNTCVFSGISVPAGHDDLQAKIESIRLSILHHTGSSKPALHLVRNGIPVRTCLLIRDYLLLGRVDPEFPSPAKEGDIVLPGEFAAVTRITRPHGVIIRSGNAWYLEDRGSSGGTYINGERIASMQKARIRDGDIIDLSTGPLSARFLFAAPE